MTLFQHTACFASWKSLVERTGRTSRQVVKGDPDLRGFGDSERQRGRAYGREVDGIWAVSGFDLAPGPMRVQEDE